MPNELHCTGFPAAYPTLSGPVDLGASHEDITRAMLTVGYASRHSAARYGGPWRALLLRAMVRGYLDRSLRTTPYFRNLERSEKAAMSFLLAQAFTHYFAQFHMGLVSVVHVSGASERFTWLKGAASLKPGAGAMNPNARPDFIGLAPGEYHVFESKGRSRSISSAAVAEALSQASMIATVNGIAPTTRVAACFCFKEGGTNGRVLDPEEADVAYALSFDEVAAARKAYAFFLEPEVRNGLVETVPGFRCVDIGDGVIYGIDEKLLPKLDDLDELAGEERPAEPLLQLLVARRGFYQERRAEPDISVGNDGILLKGPTALPPRLRRLRRRL